MTFEEMLKHELTNKLGLKDNDVQYYTAKATSKAFLGIKNEANAERIVEGIIPAELKEHSVKSLSAYFETFDYDFFKNELLIEVNKLNKEQ